MEVKVIEKKIYINELKEFAEKGYGVLVKLAVDLEKEMIALGGEYHSDCLEVLIENGSSGKEVWGANIYPEKTGDERIEYVALINIRPSLGNRDVEIEDRSIRERMKIIIDKFIE